jgi:hypothetical protein
VAARPRNFMPLDVDYYRQDTILDLREEFGNDGPATFLVIIAEAHRQAHAGQHAKQGEVNVRYAALARELGLNAERVAGIVAGIERAGLIGPVGEPEEGRLRGRLTKWDAWESRDVTAAERQRRARAARGE